MIRRIHIIHLVGAIAAFIMLFLMFRDARAAPPICLEGFSGKAAPVMPRWERGSLGHHVYWYCLNDDDSAIVTGFSCLHGVCDISKFSGTLQDITVAPDKGTAATAAWIANFAFDCTDAVRAENSDRGHLCVERRQIYDANKAVWNVGLPAAASAPPPPRPAWVVAKNGISGGRPAFPVVNGKRSYSSDGTIPVGSACDCTTKLVEGSLTFCQVAAAHVAVCSPTN